MSRKVFKVTAVWDEDAKVYYSQSDIDGLHIEAETLEEFEDLLLELGPELALANHLVPDNSDRPLSELVPAIVWQRPTAA